MPRPPLRFAAYGILPTLGVVRLKRTMTHKDALKYILEHGGRLSNRYGMKFYAGTLREPVDPVVAMDRMLRKLGG